MTPPTFSQSKPTSTGPLSGSLALDNGTVDLDRDRTLVARCQAGDSSAFDELYRRYHQRLVRFCRRRLDDHHEAEDAAHEAFAKAWRALPNFAGQRRFYPWLTVIAANVCTDVLRRRSRTTPIDQLPVTNLERRASVDEGAEARLVDRVDAAMAIEALAKLSERHQRVLTLREASGWSTKRIADHEGVSVSVVETLLWRARRSLQREFAALADTGSQLGVGLLGWSLAFRRLLRHGRVRVDRTVSRLSPLRSSLHSAASSTSSGWSTLTANLSNAPVLTAVGTVALAGGLFVLGTQVVHHDSSSGDSPAKAATSTTGARLSASDTAAKGDHDAGGETSRGRADPSGSSGAASKHGGAAGGAGDSGHHGSSATGSGGASAAFGASSNRSIADTSSSASSGTGITGLLGGGGSGSSGGSGAGSTVSSLAGQAGNLGSGASGLGDTIGSGVSTATSGVGSTVTGVGQGVGSTVSGVGATLGGGSGTVTSGVGSTVTGVGQGVGSTVSGVGSTVTGVGQGIGSTVSGVGATLGGL